MQQTTDVTIIARNLLLIVCLQFEWQRSLPLFLFLVLEQKNTFTL